MGIDWFRFRLRPDADLERLRQWRDTQAVAFQALPSMWEIADLPAAVHPNEEAAERLSRQYGEASQAIRQVLEIAADDSEEFPPCWRVYPITHNSLFPTPMRVAAHRTIFPDELPAALAEWRGWLAEVRTGRHRPYLLALHVCLTARRLHSLFPDLQRVAQHSLQSSAKWANAPELVTVRERILAERLPEVPPIPEWNPHDPSAAVGADVDATYRVIWRAVDEVIALTRTWDYHARSNHRVRYYEAYYPTWEQFLARAEDAWTLSFLAWADECVEQGWGLYLNY